MNGTLGSVLLAASAFVGGHFVLSWPPVRSKLVKALGNGLFTALYSLLMVLFLVWLVAAYRVAPPLVIWDLGPKANLAPVVVMPFALILAVLGLTSRSPTAVMGERLLRAQVPVAAGALTITRHPFLWGAALWALAHLIANGDMASIILFGSIALLSIGGMFAIDRRRALELGDAWSAFAARTSRVPFAAVISGRTKADWAGIGWARPLAGLALYVALLFGHDWLFGAPVVIL